jgi:hypothetical protein
MHLPSIPGLATWGKFTALATTSAGRAVIAVLASTVLIILAWPALKTLVRGRASVRRAQSGQGQASDATLLYQRMLVNLERRGIRKPGWQTPAEFARGIPEPELSLVVEDLTSAYNEFRFGGRAAAAPRMIRLLENLESLPR